MAISDKNQLSDKDLVIGTSQLSELSSKWSSGILNTGLSSLNIKGAFSALTGQGIGTSYITSLENAIKQAEEKTLNISKLIGSTAMEQVETDEKNAASSDDNGYGTNNNNNNYSGNTSFSNNTGSYSGNSNPQANIDPGQETQKKELSEEEQIKVVSEFVSIFNGILADNLFDDNAASKIKEQLLASPNISKETKEIITAMEPKTIQVNLQNILLSGETTSGFSKLVITIFDQRLKHNNEKATIFDVSDNISKTYSKLASKEDVQEDLHNIYNGIMADNEADENVVNITRDFIDTLSVAHDVSYEDILSNAKYKEELSAGVKDLANTMAIINGAKGKDSTVTSKLYSNIIVKQKG